MTEIEKTLTLRDGNKMPLVGFGTYLLSDQETMDLTIKTAYEAGYRLFDTAQFYRNEDFLGQSLVNLQIPRDEVFITSKVAEFSQGYDLTIAGVEDSLKRLKSDYIDLMLVHWPIQSEFFDTWRALEKLKQDGKVKSIGVSNYQQIHLQFLATQAKEMPAVNQVERHPYLTNQPLVKYDKQENIVTQAWSPLGRGVVLDNPMIKKIAAHHDKTIAQVILRWQIQQGVAIIPKSKTPERIKENIDIFDFELAEDEMGMIDLLNKNQRTGNEPELVYELGRQY
ncbi:glyoxal reductase [Secundilactobacillus oryzae JCM 18671]|uniref:Glyoxal reductase n=2 Tax=Secundilactobacillus oryzae TaxID=1202668 RepID=A0A081BKT4_9LACO|nr:aldo/keto reductase [Secundilactobacillus oryzae]GAK48652.1 glyoxal reductase [Secundilactobacillus oryzae JCM 18671]